VWLYYEEGKQLYAGHKCGGPHLCQRPCRQNTTAPAKTVKLVLWRALSALGLAVLLLPSLVFRLAAQEMTGLATRRDHEVAQVQVRVSDEVTITESPDLEAWYAIDNSLYFRGKLPVVMVGWADMPGALGETFFADGKPDAVAIDRSLGEYSPVLTRCVLLHEEAHIARGKEGHDAIFRTKLLKAIKMGGCPGLVS
jgi:hypothetical protein